jgi:uncharacterized protein (DUF2384 family)
MGSSSQYARREQLTFLQFLRYWPQEENDGFPPDAPAARITELSKSLGLPRCKVLAFLGISSAGVNRRVHSCLPLSADETARMLGIESLIGHVRAMVEGGAPGEAAGFDAARWLGQWLRQRLPALGGRLPASYLHTLDGQRLVRKILAMIASSSYA